MLSRPIRWGVWLGLRSILGGEAWGQLVSAVLLVGVGVGLVVMYDKYLPRVQRFLLGGG